MKYLALFGAIFLLSVPLAQAETLQSTVTKELCKPGTVKKPARTFNPGGEQSSLSKMVAEGNLCTNDRMTVSTSNGKVYEESTCICPIQQEPDKEKKEAQLLDSIGCGKDKQGKNQRQPTVTITIPRDISGCTRDSVVVTKCAADLEKAYEAGCQRGVGVSFVDTDSEANISIASADTVRNYPSLGALPQSDMIVKALTDTGVPLEKAQEIARTDRQGAADYINALASRDIEKAQAKATALGINPDLATDQGVLEAAQQAKKDLANNPLETNSIYRSAPTSFSSSDGGTVGNLPRQCGMDGYAGNFMFAESGCNRSPTNSINPYVGGAHHYLCETWQADVRATGLSQYQDCKYRFDVEASSEVVNARYAQHEATYGSRCTAAGVSVTSCMYAIHVFGEGGFRNILAAQERNPLAPASVLCGSAVSAGACSGNSTIFTNGGTVQGVFGELDRRLAGGSVITSYSTNTGGSFGALGGITSGGSQSLVYNTGSPMAQASLFGNFGNGSFGGGFGGLNLGQLFQPRQQQQNPYPQQQYPYQAPPIQQPVQQPVVPIIIPPPIVTPTTTPVTPPVTSTTTATTSPQTSVKPIANLVIQPKTVAINTPLVVSWTSVGMRSDQPCILFQAGKEIARGSSGARQVTVPFATSTTFVLSCTSVAGEKVEKQDTAVIN